MMHILTYLQVRRKFLGVNSIVCLHNIFRQKDYAGATRLTAIFSLIVIKEIDMKAK